MEVIAVKYSIIIPIYNSEKTLRRCLDSLMPQTNSDIEVLLINDGSTDLSGDICKEYMQKNRSFRCYSQENAGVSVARNNGLDKAKGKYILFVDSDDYVDANYIEVIDSSLEEENPDLLIFSVAFLNCNRNSETMLHDDVYCSGKNAYKLIAFLDKQQKMNSLCNKVFINQIISDNHIRFCPDIYDGEDSIFIFNYLLYINRILTKHDILYYADESSQNSLSRKRKRDLSHQLIMASKYMQEMLIICSLEKEKLCLFKRILSRRYYRGAYSCFLEASRWIDDKSDLNNEITAICLEYNKNPIKPIGYETSIMSIPVRFTLTPIIKSILFMKNKGQ